ncbi:MAG: hypothetical protein AAFR31_09035 [Cyanobacteria bacterium J06627_8]
MTQKIRLQASRFWNVLASESTRVTYKNALDVTITILKEGLLLIWLLLCLVLVFFDWGAEKSTAAGQQTRNWVNALQEGDSSQFASSAKQTLLLAGKSSVINTIAKARQELGLPEKEVLSESAQTVQVKATTVPTTPKAASANPASSSSSAQTASTSKPAQKATPKATPAPSAPASAPAPVTSSIGSEVSSTDT